MWRPGGPRVGGTTERGGRVGWVRTADGRREGLLALLANLQRDEGHCERREGVGRVRSDGVVCVAKTVGRGSGRSPGNSLCTVHSRVPPKAPTMRFSVSLRGKRLFPSTTEAAKGVSGGKSRVCGSIDDPTFPRGASDLLWGVASAVAEAPGRISAASFLSRESTRAAGVACGRCVESGGTRAGSSDAG